MIDLTKHLEADSDCIVAADLVAGPRIIKITGVVQSNGKGDKKKIDLHYEGMDGKPFRPCKSMLRVMCELWATKDAEHFIGRSVQLYREQNCLWKGEVTPGVRISGMSHIEKPVTVVVHEKRGKASKYEIALLLAQESPANADEMLKRTVDAIARASKDRLLVWAKTLDKKIESEEIQSDNANIIRAAIEARLTELAPGDGDKPEAIARPLNAPPT